MNYTSQAELMRMKALSDALRGNNNQQLLPNWASGLAYMLNQYNSGRLDRQATEAEQKNQQIQAQELARILSENQSGFTGPQANLGSYQSPDAQGLAMTLALRKMNEAPPAPIKLGKGDRLIDPGNYQELVGMAPEPVDYNKPFLPDGSPNPAYQEYETQLRTAGRPETTINNNPGGNRYAETRQGDSATAMQELGRAAESAYRSNQNLERMRQASASAPDGAAASVMQGVMNLLASFGYSSESLTSADGMNMAINDILANKMQEMGARGLTDSDMKILNQSLPQLNQSHESRMAIIDILRKYNDVTINEFKGAVDWERSTYPDMRVRYPSWLDDWSPQGAAPNSTMTEEEQAEYFQLRRELGLDPTN